MPVEDGLACFERTRDPASQRPCAHGRPRGVDHAPERGARPAGVARVEDLQVRQRGRVELQVVAFVVDPQRLYVIERPPVTGRGLTQRGAGRSDAWVFAFQTDAAQRLRAEVAAK